MVVELVVIVPVLNRPERVESLIASFEAAKHVNSEILFITSPGDDAERIEILRTGATSIEALWVAGPADFARKTNLGAKIVADFWPSAPFVFAGADDLDFHAGWDAAALEAAESGVGMVGTNDLGNRLVMRGEHSTHSLFRQTYIKERGASWDGPGRVYSESYDHQYVDTEAVWIAKQRGEWAFAPDSKVEHRHFLWGKSEQDETYRKAMAKGAEDGKLFAERRGQFG